MKYAEKLIKKSEFSKEHLTKIQKAHLVLKMMAAKKLVKMNVQKPSID